jgi:hypothetical protein
MELRQPWTKRKLPSLKDAGRYLTRVLRIPSSLNWLIQSDCATQELERASVDRREFRIDHKRNV